MSSICIRCKSKWTTDEHVWWSDNNLCIKCEEEVEAIAALNLTLPLPQNVSE